jgi:uncharacterized membrane protein YhaH (DUF805 family)
MFSVILYMLRQTLRFPLALSVFSPLTVTSPKLAVISRPLHAAGLYKNTALCTSLSGLVSIATSRSPSSKLAQTVTFRILRGTPFTPTEVFKGVLSLVWRTL